MKLPSRKRIFEWVLEAWSQLSKENIIKSFKCCGLNLNSQLSILDESDAVNPLISLSDEEDVNEEMNLIEYETDEEIVM